MMRHPSSRLRSYATDKPFAESQGLKGDYSEYDPYYRDHFKTHYGQFGRNYDYYQPAYFYGYDLARNPQYRNRPWDQIEMDARRSWEGQHQDTLWDDIKDAVREGWMRVTGQR